MTTQNTHTISWSLEFITGARAFEFISCSIPTFFFFYQSRTYSNDYYNDDHVHVSGERKKRAHLINLYCTRWWRFTMNWLHFSVKIIPPSSIRTNFYNGMEYEEVEAEEAKQQLPHDKWWKRIKFSKPIKSEFGYAINHLCKIWTW